MTCWCCQTIFETHCLLFSKIVSNLKKGCYHYLATGNSYTKDGAEFKERNHQTKEIRQVYNFLPADTVVTFVFVNRAEELLEGYGADKLHGSDLTFQFSRRKENATVQY